MRIESTRILSEPFLLCIAYQLSIEPMFTRTYDKRDGG